MFMFIHPTIDGSINICFNDNNIPDDFKMVDSIDLNDDRILDIDIIAYNKVVFAFLKDTDYPVGKLESFPLIENEDNLFDIDPKDFGTIKNILRAIGTIDSRVIDEFVVKDGQ